MTTTNGTTRTWAGLADAAGSLGCSIRTIQRRMRRGDIEHRKDANGRVEVLLPADVDARASVVNALAHQSDIVIRMSESLSKSLSDALSREQAAVERLEDLRRRGRWFPPIAAAACVMVATLSVALSLQVRAGARQAADLMSARAAAAAAGRLEVELEHATLTATASGEQVRRLSAMVDGLQADRELLHQELQGARAEVASWRADALLGRLADGSTSPGR